MKPVSQFYMCSYFYVSPPGSKKKKVPSLTTQKKIKILFGVIVRLLEKFYVCVTFHITANVNNKIASINIDL